MTETLSVLAAQRANDNDLCERLRSETIIAEHEQPAMKIEWPDGRVEECGPSVSHTVRIRNPDGAEAATRIEQLSQELAEASHDRDRYQADLERLRAEHTDCIPVFKFPVFYPTED